MAPRACFVPLECSEGTEAGEGHQSRRRRKAARIAEFSRDRERRQIVDAAEAAETLDARSQGFEGEQIAQLGIDGVKPRDGFVDGAHGGAMCLLERGDGPVLGLEPVGMSFGPRAFGQREATPVPEEEFGEAVSGAEQVGANVFSTAQQIARGFLLLSGNVDGGERPGAIEHGQLAGIPTIGFDAITGTAGDQRWRDDVTWDVVGGEGALQLEATRASFVAALYRCGAP